MLGYKLWKIKFVLIGVLHVAFQDCIAGVAPMMRHAMSLWAAPHSPAVLTLSGPAGWSPTTGHGVNILCALISLH